MDSQAELDYESQIHADVIQEHATIPGWCAQCETGTECATVANARARLAALDGRVALRQAPVDAPVIEHRPIASRPQAGAPASNQFGTFKVHTASPAQHRFVKALLNTKDLTTLGGSIDPKFESATRAAVEAGTLSKKAASFAIDQLMGLPDRKDLPVARATDKQVSLIKRLVGERDLGGQAIEDLVTGRLEDLAPKQASAVIDRLFQMPKKVATAKAPEFVHASGIYQVGTEIFKVYWNQGKTHMLAKRLVVTGPGEATFEYAGAAGRFVPAEVAPMTLEQAKAFGAIYGVCCNCGATLTDETSIEAGIGPVCAKRFA